MLTFEERVLCGNPLQRSGSGSEPDPEPNREFGPVVNTNVKAGRVIHISCISHFVVRVQLADLN